MSPKAFISHASEDKGRFVLGFAKKLREKGVVAWLDKWEMLPGDSLVDRIFEEGIKSADVFIIVLSTNSVTKRWVREELNAGFVNRIARTCKIIPVVIDDCEVPECLRSTVWERIPDLTTYDEQLSRIVNAIFGLHEKPPLGSAPAHSRTLIDSFPNLSKVDAIIFTVACQKAMQSEYGYPNINTRDICDELRTQGITDAELLESLDILDRQGYINATKVIGGAIPSFTIRASGFDEYARAQFNDYDLIVRDISLRIVNEDQRRNTDIAEKTKYPIRLVTHIFDMLELRGFVTLSRIAGVVAQVAIVRPELKRLLRTSE